MTNGILENIFKQISKYLFLFLFSNLSLSSMAQDKKESEMTNWVIFDKEKTKDFSESFKKELSIKLKEQFNWRFEEENIVESYDFFLIFGKTDLNTIVKNNYVFAIVEISAPDAKLYKVTASWSSKDFSNPLDIQKSDVSNKNVEFSWCADFPLEDFKEYLNPYKEIKKGENDFRFDLIISPFTFPDIAVKFIFDDKKTTSETLTKIENEFIKFNDKYKKFFFLGFDKSENENVILLDYNTIDFNKYSDADLSNDLDLLIEIFKNINSNHDIIGLKKIIVK